MEFQDYVLLTQFFIVYSNVVFEKCLPQSCVCVKKVFLLNDIKTELPSDLNLHIFTST